MAMSTASVSWATCVSPMPSTVDAASSSTGIACLAASATAWIAATSNRTRSEPSATTSLSSSTAESAWDTGTRAPSTRLASTSTRVRAALTSSPRTGIHSATPHRGPCICDWRSETAAEAFAASSLALTKSSSLNAASVLLSRSDTSPALALSPSTISVAMAGVAAPAAATAARQIPPATKARRVWLRGCPPKC